MGFLVHPQTGKKLTGLKPFAVHKVGMRGEAWSAFDPKINMFGVEPNRGQVVPDLQSTRVTRSMYLGQESARGLLEQPLTGFSIKHNQELKGLAVAGVSVAHYVKTSNTPHVDGPVPILRLYSFVHSTTPLSAAESGMLKKKLESWHGEVLNELESRGIVVKPTESKR